MILRERLLVTTGQFPAPAFQKTKAAQKQSAIENSRCAISLITARRALALERTPGSAWVAFQLAARAWGQASLTDRRRVVRMFFTGPGRALGLRPA